MNRRIWIERAGNRIHLKTPWRPNLPEKCKSIPGWGWSSSKKMWTYPLDYGTCVALRKTFGSLLDIGPELFEWAKASKVRHEELAKLSKAHAADLEKLYVVAPRLAQAMEARTYQQVGTAWLKTAKYGLLADQPGLGKTIQVIAAHVEANVLGPILIMCPKTAVNVVWVNEIRKWLDEENELIYPILGTKPQRKDLLEEAMDLGHQLRGIARTWVICNIEMAQTKYKFMCLTSCYNNPFSEKEEEFDPDCENSETHKKYVEHSYPELFSQPWSSIVVDESHRSLITKSSFKTKMTQRRAGMAMLKTDSDGYRIALSGTPNRGKIENLWGTFNWLRPDLYNSYWRWAKKYFEVYNDGFSDWIGESKSGDVLTELDRDMNSVMLRRTKFEVLPDLPPKEYPGTDVEGVHGIWLPMSVQQARVYKQMTEEALAKLDNGTLHANGLLAEMTRLKQFAASYGSVHEVWGTRDGEKILLRKFKPGFPSNKLEWVLEFLAERGIEEGEITGEGKIVIASQYTTILNFFSRTLTSKGIDNYRLTGQVKDDDRQKFIEDFQNNPDSPRVFLINTMAGGVAVTLDSADDLVFLDETWIPDDQEQVEDRIHRTSRMHNVRIWYVRSLGSIEENIAKVNIDRDDLQKGILDARRGVDIARKLISG